MDKNGLEGASSSGKYDMVARDGGLNLWISDAFWKNDKRKGRRINLSLEIVGDNEFPSSFIKNTLKGFRKLKDLFR